MTPHSRRMRGWKSLGHSSAGTSASRPIFCCPLGCSSTTHERDGTLAPWIGTHPLVSVDRPRVDASLKSQLDHSMLLLCPKRDHRESLTSHSKLLSMLSSRFAQVAKSWCHTLALSYNPDSRTTQTVEVQSLFESVANLVESLTLCQYHNFDTSSVRQCWCPCVRACPEEPLALGLSGTTKKR